MEIIEKIIKLDEDWQMLLSFMPHGWREKAKELGALKRSRSFKDAGSLLRVLMIHFVDGCSLRETSARAKLGGIASVSDVALLKRLKRSGEWLRWSAMGVMQQCTGGLPANINCLGLNFRVIDGSMVSEPGSTGSDWRIHYSINLGNLYCDEMKVTRPKVGESLKNFTVKPNDVLIADRGYSHAKGIEHVQNSDGYSLIRLNSSNLPLFNQNGETFDLLENLRQIKLREYGDWEVYIKGEKNFIRGRVCAIKKNKAATDKAKKKALRAARRKGHKIRPQTLAAAGYVFVFTTLPSSRADAVQVMEIYRARWQIELSFKRLKSLVGIGHLPKQDLIGAKAWLHGKLLVAFLVEAIILAGERFSPWGYPLYQDSWQAKMHLA